MKAGGKACSWLTGRGKGSIAVLLPELQGAAVLLWEIK